MKLTRLDNSQKNYFNSCVRWALCCLFFKNISLNLKISIYLFIVCVCLCVYLCLCVCVCLHTQVYTSFLAKSGNNFNDSHTNAFSFFPTNEFITELT